MKGNQSARTVKTVRIVKLAFIVITARAMHTSATAIAAPTSGVLSVAFSSFKAAFMSF